MPIVKMYSKRPQKHDKKISFTEKDKKSINKVNRRQALARPEPKNFDTVIGDEAMTNATNQTATCLSLVPQGDGNRTRDGNQIRVFGLSLKMFQHYIVNGDSTTTNAYWNTRILVFIDLDTNVATRVPTTADVLDLSVITNPVIAPKNWLNRHRFKILFDKKFIQLGYKATATQLNLPSVLRYITMSKKLHNMKIEFNNSGTTNGQGKNQIYILPISDEAGGLNDNIPALTVGARITYIDN